jgi:histidinol-phosphate aminotransferase
LKLNIPENIAAIIPYPPGKPIDEFEREYGIKNPVKLASNENPWGPSPAVVEALRAELTNLHRYPDGSCYYLCRAIAEKTGVDPVEVVIGNGSNEVIEFLVKAFVREGDEVISSHPSFLMYQKFVQVRGGVNHVVPLKNMGHDLEAIARKVSQRSRLIFIDNPNNPTGTAIPLKELEKFLKGIPEHLIVVLDEAYLDFMDPDMQPDVLALLRQRQNLCGVVLLRTFSKAYGLPGLRVGFGLMPAEIAQCLHKVRQPFNINQLGQIASLAALEDQQYYQQTLRRTRESIDFLRNELGKMGCSCYPTQTNFFLVDVHGDADTLYQRMLKQGVIIRSMSAYGFTTFIRITAGTIDENICCVGALKKCLAELGYVK